MYAITITKTMSAIIASVVIISSAKVLVKIHRHHSFLINYERSKKRYLLLSLNVKGATATVMVYPW